MTRVDSRIQHSASNGCRYELFLCCKAFTLCFDFRRLIKCSTHQGGNVLGNGTWLNVGGNQAVTYGGEEAPDQVGNGGPYHDPDGRNSYVLLLGVLR